MDQDQLRLRMKMESEEAADQQTRDIVADTLTVGKRASSHNIEDGPLPTVWSEANGAAQMATANTIPQITGLVSPALEAATGWRIKDTNHIGKGLERGVSLPEVVSAAATNAYPNPDHQPIDDLKMYKDYLAGQYRLDRDNELNKINGIKAKHPTAYKAGQVEGAFLSPGATMDSWLGSGLVGGGQGLISGLAQDPADLTKGEKPDLANAAISTGLGVTGGLASKAISVGGDALLNKAASRVAAAKAADIGTQESKELGQLQALRASQTNEKIGLVPEGSTERLKTSIDEAQNLAKEDQLRSVGASKVSSALEDLGVDANGDLTRPDFGSLGEVLGQLPLVKQGVDIVKMVPTAANLQRFLVGSGVLSSATAPSASGMSKLPDEDDLTLLQKYLKSIEGHPNVEAAPLHENTSDEELLKRYLETTMDKDSKGSKF